MNPSCTSVRERLGLLADGSLDSPEERDLRRHLDECPECRREERLMLGTIEALQSLSAVPVPDTFRRRLHERLQTEAALATVRTSVSRTVALAASVALIVGLGVGLGVGAGLGVRIASAGKPDGAPAPELAIEPVSARPGAVPVRNGSLPAAPRSATGYRYIGGADAGHPRDYYLAPPSPNARPSHDEDLPSVVYISF